MTPAEIQLAVELAPVAEKLIEDIIGLFKKHAPEAAPPTEAVAATVKTALAAAPVVSADTHQAALAQVADLTAQLANATAPAPAGAPHGVVFTGSGSVVQNR